MNKKYPLSLQETFDIGYKGVVNQGSLCVDGGTCVYVGENNKSCVAGHVLAYIEPDLGHLEDIDARGGEKVSDILIRMGYFTAREIHPEYARLLSRMQTAHDAAHYLSSGSMSAFRDNMQVIAKNFGLDFPDDESRQGD